MIYIYLISEWDINFDFIVNNLPKEIYDFCMKFHFEKDRIRYAVGKHLAAFSLHQSGYPIQDCYDFKVDENSRPYLNNDIDFNISHAGNYVICAISAEGRVV